MVFSETDKNRFFYPNRYCDPWLKLKTTSEPRGIRLKPDESPESSNALPWSGIPIAGVTRKPSTLQCSVMIRDPDSFCAPTAICARRAWRSGEETSGARVPCAAPACALILIHLTPLQPQPALLNEGMIRIYHEDRSILTKTDLFWREESFCR